MIKAVIFDFDGVIIDSADIKTRAFGLLFAEKYPEFVHSFVEYHKQHMGISRFKKIRYFYEHMLGITLPLEQEQQWGDKFSELVMDEILKAPLVKGTEEFLSSANNYTLFIASGTPKNELQLIVTKRQLSEWFQELHGSPQTKTEIISNILYRYGYAAQDVAFVGDANTDREAALATGVNFIARIAPNNKQLLDCHDKIHDLSELHTMLIKLSGANR